MKKILTIIIVLLIALGPLFAQEISTNMNDMSGQDIIEFIDQAQDIGVGISKVGFKTWFMSNWWLLILAIVGLGKIIVWLTPSKEDDKWYSKWILRPLSKIGGLMQLIFKGDGIGKKDVGK